MHTRRKLLTVLTVAVFAMLTGCGSEIPSPVPSPSQTTTSPPSPSAPAAPPPTETPTPTPAVPETFPLAVVTGFTNLKATITLDELSRLASGRQLVTPCGVEIEEPTLTPTPDCVAPDDITSLLMTDPSRIALLPPGLVEPATKVLRIAGDGPFGLFGPDLFGDPQARAMEYPVTGSAMPDDPALEPVWLDYDPSEIWTLTNLGSLCADRGAAYETVAVGRGWEWAFNGGTAEYQGEAVVDPPDEGPYHPVQPIETGHDGATASIVERSDVAIADHECPIMPSESWEPNLSSDSFAFSVPEELVPIWRDTLGLDVIYLAANHMTDKGIDGIRSTIQLLDEYGLPRTGLGMNLDEALEPAYVEVAGLKVAFVAHNDVNGATAADAQTPGVAWLTEENVHDSVRRARDGGADLVICNPQWWGGAEYHADLWPVQVEQLGWFDDAGCDHVIGSGTHVAGPLLLDRVNDDVRAVLASPGNYMFGQGWWQETQEGVILDMTFRGTTLVNVRLHPTVQILQARPALLDPEGDGRYVLQRMWKYGEVDYMD